MSACTVKEGGKKAHIDYHITFPTTGTDELEASSDVDQQNTTEKTPVVILLGWAGCVDKYLEKYSKIYTNNGCITLRFIAPLSHHYVCRWKHSQDANNILQELVNSNLDSHPLFFHVFSNSGCFVFQYIPKLLRTNEEYSHMRIHGCILDSAPCEYKMTTNTKALAVVLDNWNFLFRYTALGLFSCGHMLYDVMFLLIQLWNNEKYVDVYEAMCDDTSQWPQLYLYSSADTMTVIGEVEECIERRNILGVHVETMVWDDSGHVEHFRKHPEVYQQRCVKFLRSCIDTSPKKEAYHSKL